MKNTNDTNSRYPMSIQNLLIYRYELPLYCVNQNFKATSLFVTIYQIEYILQTVFY